MPAKILLLGQGAIGTMIGAAFKASGMDAFHLPHHPENVRPSVQLTFRDMRKTGMKIKKGTAYAYDCIAIPAQTSAFDTIFLPLSHRHWREAVASLKPFLHQGQTLVLSGNVWDDFEWFRENIPVPYVFAFPNFGGAVSNGALGGWLTPKFTLGVTNTAFSDRLEKVSELLHSAGFRPQVQTDIRGWLMTHFAFNAGLLAEAAAQNGFGNMTRNWDSLLRAYRRARACVQVAEQAGVRTSDFPEGRQAHQALWWNALKTRLLFLIPGLAESADAGKNLEEWSSYYEKVRQTAEQVPLEILP